MGFEKAGTFRLSKSGKSFTVQYTDPFTLLMRELFLNREDVRKVESGEVAQGDVYVLKPKERNEVAGSHRS